MSRLAVLLLLFFFLNFSCHKRQEKPLSSDFETLMGKELPQWKYVQTKEDFENLAFFKAVYETNILALGKGHSKNLKIPKILHFIWIGPDSFPRESIENVRSWIAHHPDWKYKFWTDRQRPLPHPTMEFCLIREFPFVQMEKFYYTSDNYGEKSDLLRLEILYQQGGLYIDHDVTCLKDFTPLIETYDFFCGMEVPYPTSLSSSLYPTNNLLGAKPFHPLIKESMQWLEENWDRIEKEYPGKDRDALINRISHRTFRVLGDMFKKYGNQEGNVDIAFPSYYFNAPDLKKAIYARHQYQGKWFENESAFEKMARKRLMMLSKKTNKLLLLVGVVGVVNLMGLVMLCYMIHQSRKHLYREKDSRL